MREFGNIIYESYLDDFDENDIEDVYYSDDDDNNYVYIEEYIKNNEIIQDDRKLLRFSNSASFSIKAELTDTFKEEMHQQIFEMLYERCEYLFSPLNGVPFVVQKLQVYKNAVTITICYDKLKRVPFVKFHNILNKLLSPFISISSIYNTKLESATFISGARYIYSLYDTDIFTEYDLASVYRITMTNSEKEYKELNDYDFYSIGEKINVDDLKYKKSHHSRSRYKLFDYPKVEKYVFNLMNKHLPDNCTFKLISVSQELDNVINFDIEFNYDKKPCEVLTFFKKFVPMIPFRFFELYNNSGYRVQFNVHTDMSFKSYSAYDTWKIPYIESETLRVDAQKGLGHIFLIQYCVGVKLLTDKITKYGG